MVVDSPDPFLLQEFTSYLQKHDEVLTELEKATKRLKKLEMVYKEFELQKVCYLPLNTFLLKPIQRLMHYKLILERLCKHYTPEHRDFDDCKGEVPMGQKVRQSAGNEDSNLRSFCTLIWFLWPYPPHLPFRLYQSLHALPEIKAKEHNLSFSMTFGV